MVAGKVKLSKDSKSRRGKFSQDFSLEVEHKFCSKFKINFQSRKFYKFDNLKKGEIEHWQI